jgi:ABC-type transporter Mla maintaining outer membrane lipid asymmetry ATPase subunit MlaF
LTPLDLSRYESAYKENPTSKSDLVIALEGVSKKIKNHLILDDVHLNVPPGKIYGISG